LHDYELNFVICTLYVDTEVTALDRVAESRTAQLDAANARLLLKAEIEIVAADSALDTVFSWNVALL
jgi:hypothetical protein